MVQAYTLSDRIVQQGYNDIQELVGMVFKVPDGGVPESSSYEALKAANAQPIAAGQVAAYYVDASIAYETSNYTKSIITSPSNNDLLINLTTQWVQSGSDQWVQIRRLETTPVLNGTTLDGILYKIVADAFLSTAP